MVKDTSFEAGASALGCIGRRTGSWVCPRPLRELSLGSKACSDFVGVSGVSLGFLGFDDWMISGNGVSESDLGTRHTVQGWRFGVGLRRTAHRKLGVPQALERFSWEQGVQ